MFAPGQTVIHPHHGPMQVSQIVTRSLRGVDVRYLELDTNANLRITVPVAQAELIGLRPVMSREEVAGVLGILRAPSLPRENSWSRRIKDYQLRLQSGSATERAVVMREILRGSGLHASGIAERDLLRSCMAVLTSEVSLALAVSEERAQELLVDAAGPREAEPGRPRRRGESDEPADDRDLVA